MDDQHDRRTAVFFEVQRGLPRQGPGGNESTLRALSLCDGLPVRPRVADVGCGPGTQTLALAEATGGSVVAIDLCEEYLEQLRARASAAGLGERVEARVGDMGALDLPESSFDLLWSEGAAYVIGVPEALRKWRPLLRDGGYLAFTELVWLVPDPPAEAHAYFTQMYPPMQTVDGVRRIVAEAHYQRVDDFTLPDSAWWDDYYGPLEAKLPGLRAKFAGDELALEVIAMSEQELDMRRRFGASYGYQFFVARRA